MELSALTTLVFELVGGLGLFLLGMKNMSEGMQAVAGSSLRRLIGTATNNRFMATTVGAVVTCIVQSSSITTSLLVPMIAAGILSIEAAFPIVIGANIGTTGTAILASFATGNPSAIVIAFVHFLFNLIGVLVIYPIKPFRTIPINLAKALGDLAHEKRHYALIYVLGVFFVVPGLLVLVYKLLT